MSQHDNELERLVLEAVSHDFEPLESVIGRVCQHPTESRGSIDDDQIKDSLLASIAMRHIGAYLLHAEAPYLTAVSVTSDTIENYWYYITESGHSYLESMDVENQDATHQVPHSASC